MGHYAKRFFNQNFILGDKYPASLIFSLRKIVSNYNGNCIQIRRNDNSVMAIGFDSNGVVDTAAILSFIGSGNAFVRAIYDQSGSGKYLYQPTATAQALIASSGTIYRDALTNNPLIKFTGVNVKSYNLYAAGALVNIPELANQINYSILAVIRTESGGTTGDKCIYGASNNGMSLGAYDDKIAYSNNSGQYVLQNMSAGGTSQSARTNGAYNINTCLFASTLTTSSASMSVNGNNVITSGLSIATPTSNNGIVVGNQYVTGAATNFYGNLFEIIMWYNDTVMGDNARIDIENNVNKYYKLY